MRGKWLEKKFTRRATAGGRGEKEALGEFGFFAKPLGAPAGRGHRRKAFRARGSSHVRLGGPAAATPHQITAGNYRGRLNEKNVMKPKARLPHWVYRPKSTKY